MNRKESALRLRCRAFLLLLVVAVLVAQSASANQAEDRADIALGKLSISQLQHRTYTSADGAPNTVMSMAQTSDGFLWLGSQDGLVRFDGVKFDDHFGKQLPSPNVHALFSDGDDLWIGYTYGGISRLQDGRLVSYSASDVPVGGIVNFVRRPDGVLWAIGNRGLAQFVDGRWLRVGKESGFPDQHIVERARIHGTLWVVGDRGAYALEAGASRFKPVDQEELERMWMRVPAGMPWQAPSSDYYSGIIDAVGDLWLFGEKGFARYRWSLGATPYVVETVTAAQGLSADYVGAMLQDREGNIWVGTMRGLDRYSVPKFTPLVVSGRFEVPSFAPAPDGSLWIGSLWQNVLHVTQAGTQTTPLGKRAWCIFADARGGIWSGNIDTLQHWQDGKLSQIPLPPALAHLGADRLDGLYQAMAVDQQGGLWLSVAKFDLYRLYQGQWSLHGGLEGLPPLPPIRLLADETGRMWFTYPNNRIAVLANGKLRTYTGADGLAVGNVQSINVRGPHVWVGGDRGVAYLERDRFTMLRGLHDETFSDTAGLIVTDAGELWLDTASGVYRVSADEVARVTADPSREVAYERFDQSDGLAGPALQVRPGPTLQQDSTGRLWVARLFGVSSINPTRVLRNTIAPSVSIQALQVGDRQYPLKQRLVLPELTRNLRFDYTAPSLTSPQRVRFRYRLDGVDTDWQDAGTRREAFYTNMEPGGYVFRVQAANEDGTWSRHDAILRFRIAPAFYQTLWFRIFVGCLVIVFLWMLYLLRLRQLAARVGIRVAERERIARDLHDTLLQGIQGLQLRLQTWAADPAVDASRRDEMGKAAQSTHDLLIDGRDRIVALRHTGSTRVGVANSLGEIGRDYASLYQSEFSVYEDGDPRAVMPEVAAEVTDIVREALRNAFVHARAGHIGLTIAWRRNGVEFVVLDNGCGIDDAVLCEGKRAGHWGLVGMRERAERMGAKFAIEHGAPRGTKVRLDVPGRVAYITSRRWFWLRLRD